MVNIHESRHIYIISYIFFFIAVIRLTFAAVPAFAQQTCLKGCICDSLTLAPMPGVVVELNEIYKQSDHYVTSGQDGVFVFNNIPEGKYKLRCSVLGYVTRELRVSGNVTDLGLILMREDIIALDAAVHTEEAIRTSQSGDTLSYNAAAYKTMMGASSEELISKMPGIAVGAREVEANGKKVSKILIDGKEYFSDDVMTALRNIPADLVSEIEVVNKLSDEGEMTGISDGEDYTAINIVTKKRSGKGAVTGRFYGGYGIPDKYIAGASVNYLGEERTATLLGMANNISKYNFVSDDLVSASSSGGGSVDGNFQVKPLSGLSSVQSFGANYSNSWFNGSYMFNRITNHNYSDNVRRRFLDEDWEQVTSTGSDFDAKNNTHRFTGKFSVNPKGKHSLVIRPSVSYQNLFDERFQKIGLHNVSLTADELTGVRDSLFKRNRTVRSDNDRWNVNARMSLVYRYRFKKSGRSLSVSASGSYYRYSGLDHSSQFTILDPLAGFDEQKAKSSSRQYRDRLTENYSFSAGTTYTEPIDRKNRLALDYRFTQTGSLGDSRTYLFDSDAGTFLDAPDLRQSAVSSNIFRTHLAGMRYNFRYRKLQVTASLSYQRVDYQGTSLMPTQYTVHRGFNNPIYSVVANLPFNPENSLRIDARSRTSNPSVSMMQGSVNLTNPSFVRSGNPDIVPSYLHNVNVRYIHTNRRKGSTVSVSMSVSGSGNYLCDSLVVDSPDFEVAEGVKLGDGNQFSKPVNLGGYYKVSGRFTYGFPVNFLSSNFNIDLSGFVSSVPGMINADYVPVHRDGCSLGGKLDSNISDRLDFTLSYNAKYVNNEYSSARGVTRNNYFTQNARGSVKWIFWKGFVLTGSLHFQQNLSIDRRYNDRLLYCDIFLGKKLFRNRMGEINIGVNDLFNATGRYFRHTINANGATDSSDLGMGRYFSIQFVYHLRHY